jgi:hypothetical protein
MGTAPIGARARFVLKAVFGECPTFHGVSESAVEVLWAKSQEVGRQAQIRKNLDDTK